MDIAHPLQVVRLASTAPERSVYRRSRPPRIAAPAIDGPPPSGSLLTATNHCWLEAAAQSPHPLRWLIPTLIAWSFTATSSPIASRSATIRSRAAYRSIPSYADPGRSPPAPPHPGSSDSPAHAAARSQSHSDHAPASPSPRPSQTPDSPSHRRLPESPAPPRRPPHSGAAAASCPPTPGTARLKDSPPPPRPPASSPAASSQSRSSPHPRPLC